MRQGPSGRRPRNRHHSGNGGNGNSGGRVRSAASLRHQTFDSNGPDVRVRGNAWQVYEKYQSLAHDASTSGDRVMAENYLQHAEHYYRIIEAIEEATQAEQRKREPAPTPFDAQPEMPSNYFTPDGQLAAAQPQPVTSGEAPVERKAPDSLMPVDQTQGEEKSSSPFFSAQEIEAEQDSSLLQKIAVQR